MQSKNRTTLKQIRQSLRTNGTAAEAVLWNLLKSRGLDGWRWRRQYSVGNIIIDFYCPKAKLGIELDGAHHYTAYGKDVDEVKMERLSYRGIRVLHFENEMLRHHPEIVVETIRMVLNGEEV